MGYNPPQKAAAWVTFPWGSSDTACSKVGFPWDQKFYQVTCSCVGSSPHVSVDLCQDPAPAWSSPGVTVSSQSSTCSGMDLLHGLQVNLFIPVDLHGLQGLRCVIMGFPKDCTGICSGTWGTSYLSFSTDLMSAEMFLSHVLTPPSSGCNYICTINFFLFLNMLAQRHYHNFRLAQSRPAAHHLGVWRDWLCQTQRKLLAALTEAIPVTPPSLPKPGHTNWIHQQSRVAGCH